MTVIDRKPWITPDGGTALTVVVFLAIVLKHASFGLVTISSSLAYIFPIVLLLHIALVSTASGKRVPAYVLWLSHLSLLVATAFFVDGGGDVLPDNSLNHLTFYLFGVRPFFTGGGIVVFPFTALSLLGAFGVLGTWLAILAAPRRPRQQQNPPPQTEDTP